MQCNPPPSNISGNSSIAPPVDQRVFYADLLVVYKFYVAFGLFAVVTNVICVMVVLSKRHMRDKYGSFGVLSFGDLLNAIGMVLAGIIRTNLINGNAYISLTSFDCLGRPWPYFFTIGGQLPALILFFMGAERLLAVYRPLIYRTYVTKKTRMIVNLGCIVISVISLLIGLFFSYLNRDVCVTGVCTVIGATGRSYGTFNYAAIILVPLIALLLSCIGYAKAKRMSASSHMRRELNKVFATLVIAAIAVVLSVIPNFILWGQNVYWIVPSVTLAQLYIGFCCNSAVDLFTFVLLKEDFRNRLLSMVSNGYLNRYFKLPDGSEETQANLRMVHSISIRPAVMTPVSEVVEIVALHRRPAKVRFQEIARQAAHIKISTDSNESNE